MMIDKVKLYWLKTNRWHRLLFIFLLAEFRLIPGGKLGFTCNDPALAYPFTGDTISWKWLIAVTILMPLVFMLVVERKYYSTAKRPSPRGRALIWYKEYIFGLLLNITIVETLKVLVGAPRPHFFNTCSPEEAATCKGSEFVSSYTCTKAHWLSQSDRSFPSGHTSMAVHAAVFISWYLHKRITGLNRTKAAHMWQAVCLSSGLFCSLSRIMDRRHHWLDVGSGAAIALAVLLYTIFGLCKNFSCSASPLKEADPITENISDTDTKKILEESSVTT